jgi:glucoamylase
VAATLARGTLSEVYWPQLDTPQTGDLELVVTDGATFADREEDATTHRVELVDPQALVYRQVDTARSGRYRIEKTTIADPAHDVVLVNVRLVSLDGGSYRAYAYFDPSLAASGTGDSASSSGDALLASDGSSASALVSSPAFGRVSSGYVGTSDGWTDLRTDFQMDWTYDSAPNGNVAQTGSEGTATGFTLALGFGATTSDALAAARASLATGWDAALAQYEQGWHSYLASLRPPPVPPDLHTQLNVALMVLAASEDKTDRGAGIASPTIPWGDAASADTAAPGGYHNVWARDLYEVASAQLTAGDANAAGRALDWLLTVQQRPDGSFPQNTTLDGKPVFASLQLDEVADPLILAWQLGRTDRATWLRLKRSADFLVETGPVTDQDRWEEASGYSPATIAAEIAGLVCAADIAITNGDTASAGLYLGIADNWQRRVEQWTFTTTGQLGPHYERVDDDGNPNDGHALALANSGGTYDERLIVDPSFLELVRLGVKPPADLRVAASVAVVDRTIEVQTPNGPAWHRYNHDGYGETEAGGPYTGAGVGRLWPVLTGERGEYEVANGRSGDSYLRAMAGFANDGYLIPEQVWDRPDPTAGGFAFGEGTGSATPLAWSMAQFVRLAADIAAGRIVDQPAVVADRYSGDPARPVPTLSLDRLRRLGRGRVVVLSGRTTAPIVAVSGALGRAAVKPRRGQFSIRLGLVRGDNQVRVVAVGGRATALRQLRVTRG